MLGAHVGTGRDHNPGFSLKSSLSPIVIASILFFTGGAVSWAQEKIGGAETVINSVQGDFSTGKQAPVAQGDSVFLNETLSTGANGKANVVLNDASKITVGPGSTIKSDAFVYSGAEKAGTVSFSITKGTLRFVTGNANKRAYTIWTPTAAIGARGASLRLEATPTGTRVINEDGTAIVCLRDKNTPVEELQKRCRGHEDGGVDLASGKVSGGKNQTCGCTTLVFPSQQATVTPSEIAVAAAPLNAVSDPFIGQSKDVAVLAQGSNGNPWCPLGTNDYGQNWLCAGWFPVAVVAFGTGVVALGASFSSESNPTPPFFVSP
jgi:FecR protein